MSDNEISINNKDDIGSILQYLETAVLDRTDMYLKTCVVDQKILLDIIKFIKSKGTKISINGQEKVVFKDNLSFDDIVNLSQKTYSKFYSMTYYLKIEQDIHKQGSLCHGESIDIYPNMRFSVCMTCNA